MSLAFAMPSGLPLWAVMVRPSEPLFGRVPEDTVAGDLFVVAHLGFFFLLLGCFGWAAWSIWRRTCRPQPHMRLIMELEEAAAARTLAEAEPARPVREKTNDTPPWERPEDWWKRG